MLTKSEKTKEQIKQVFVELMKEKGFEHIKVTDIARKAHINRGTFYLHYIDKFDLLNQLEMEIINQIKTILDSGMNELFAPHNHTEDNQMNDPAYLVTEKVLEYLYTEADFITVIISDKGDPHFLNQAKELFRDIVNMELLKQKGTDTYLAGIPQDYAEEIFLGGIINIIVHWLRKGTPESPKAIAELITLTRHMTPVDILEL
ncbi:TetR/AcrR family transcriptional regulator [Culicoidibacter larvae]|uniref:TetR/AcrR family transcriptional regulator n=1 Tax=Culicoidibacter larvae TaxID=2579976 RepID=A0A5R8QCD8_9FIRM|nr:TetR/AcrR family transcriptional regulator [Culicoidibacter larvae]TLG74168.1 TetR/AcrR family transcriptional regulator [Culicoidibacter larvae]